jgi:hypothetical protein
MTQATKPSIQRLSIEQAAIDILALINRTPAPPSVDEIKTILEEMAWVPDANCSTVLGEVRRVAACLHESYEVAGKLHPGAEFDAANAEIDRWRAALEDLENQVPNLPGSYGDLMVLAEIARFGADVGENGRTADLVADDMFVRPAARLIEAVLQFGQSSTQSTV